MPRTKRPPRRPPAAPRSGAAAPRRSFLIAGTVITLGGPAPAPAGAAETTAQDPAGTGRGRKPPRR